MVTKVGSQNFGYQLGFCTRLNLVEILWLKNVQGFWICNVLHHIPIKSQKGLISYQLLASRGCNLKFLINKNFSGGTDFQCSGTHKDHGSWVPRTHKEVNNFESLGMLPYLVTLLSVLASLCHGNAGSTTSSVSRTLSHWHFHQRVRVGFGHAGHI